MSPRPSAARSLVFFRGRETDEPGYVMRVKPQGLSILLPRYGLEAFAPLAGVDADGTLRTPYTYDDEQRAWVAPGVTLRPMDSVRVRISVNETLTHPRLEVQIIEPMPEATAPPRE